MENMAPFPNASRTILSALAMLALAAGCSRQSPLEIVSEEDDPVFRRARDLYARGMENEALENFLRLIQKRNGNAAESHLDAGNIYLEHLRDPISAIYHFKHYEALVRRASREDADMMVSLVKDRIKTAEKRFAMDFDAKIFQDPLERSKLLDTIERIRTENETLKRQLSLARTRLNALSGSQPAVASAQGPSLAVASSQAPARRVADESAPQPARAYTIESGDSLYRISRRVYGDPSRWREILEANRDVIPDEGNLRVGTTIRIP